MKVPTIKDVEKQLMYLATVSWVLRNLSGYSNKTKLEASSR